MKKIGFIALIAALLLALSSCSDSGSGYSYSDYDGYYSNDEITNFVNTYDGKW